MREILFKAKRIDNGEWVEGFYCKRKTGHYDNIGFHDEYKDCIIVEFSDGGIAFYDVDQTTICQYTGLNDKNGKKIWENDICRYYNPEDKDGIGIIKDDYVSWVSGTLSKKTMTPLFYLKCGQEWEVYGNIFDNPELLK